MRPIPSRVLVVASLALGALAQEPTPTGETPLQTALRTHAFLGRLGVEAGADCAPFQLHVEQPRRADDTWTRTVSELYAPWLAQLGTAFRRDYVLANKLEGPEGRPPLPVYVLASPAGMRNTRRYEEVKERYGPVVAFVDDPGVLVTWYDSNLARRPAHDVRHPVLVAAATRLLEREYRSSATVERWLREGLPLYLASHGAGSVPADLENPPPDAGALERTAALATDPTRRAALVLPWTELIETRTDADRLRLVRQRAIDAGLPPPAAEDAAQLFLDQAALRVHFLVRAKGARYQRDFQRYVAKALHDSAGAAQLAATFGVELADLEEEFLAYLGQLAGGELELATRPVVERRPRGAVVHEELAFEARSAEDRLALALGFAAGGDYEEAAAELEEALTRVPVGERPRLTRELDRMRALRETRDAYLAALVAREGKLRVTRGGERVTLQVLALDGALLRLAPNDEGLQSLAVTALAPLDLAQNVGSKVSDHGPEWVQPYALLLAGERRWHARLGKDAEAAALRADAEADLERLVERGTALVLLDGLARRAVPADELGARGLTASVEALWRAHGALEEVAARRAVLRSVAADAWRVVYAGRGIEEALNGDAKRLSSGKVRVTYEFDEARELDDFTSVPDYLDARRAEKFELPAGVASALEARGGALQGTGAICYRHSARFVEPTVAYELLYGRTGPGGGLATILVGVCDDGAGSYVGAWDLFDLEAFDVETEYARTAFEDGPREVKPAKTYRVELVHGGETLTLVVDGKERRSIEVGPRHTGAVFVWIHATVPIAIKKLEIEGDLATDGEDPAREEWVAARLRESGLGG